MGTWRKLLGRPVQPQPFTELVADAPLHEPLPAPLADRRALDAEQLTELPCREHSGGDEPLLQAGELRGEADPLDGDCIECLASAGREAALVEDVRDLGIGVVVEQDVDLRTHVGVRGAQLLRCQRAQQRQSRRGAAAEPDGGGDSGAA